jgi:peroxiredoxin family protein
MPMPMPVPVFIQALPGMQSFMTSMMKKTMAKKGVASVEKLRETCLEAEVKLVACQMTVTLFDFKPSDFIDNVEYAGAATFFEFAGGADICLYI